MVKPRFMLKLTALSLVLLAGGAAHANEGDSAQFSLERPLPSRPANPYANKDLPTKPDGLTSEEKSDLDHLIKVAREENEKQLIEAKKTRQDNHELMGSMPVPKTEDDLISGAVTGAIADADIADGKKNKIAGDFFYILISSSLSDDEVLSLFKQYDKRKDVSFVVRGANKKEDLFKDLTRWQQLVLDSGAEVSVNLDPMIFKTYKVNAVPTIVHEKDGDFVAKVTGISNIDYLKKKKGDLGTAGPTKEITEKSMLDMIEEGVKNLDFDKMKRDALNNYWPRQKFEQFPEASERARHTVDPTVTIPQDIVTQDGKVVAKKGKVNPLDIIPFNMKLIFFDARVEWQRQFANREFNNAESGITPILITTDVYGDGWQTFQDTDKYYGEHARLYMIQPGMAKRYGITAVPSIVTGDKTHFIVDEYPMSAVENKGERK